MQKKKATAGRPSLYKPEYCKALIDHLASGLSFESFAATIDVNRDTLYEWEKVHPAFSDARKIGTEKSLIFWEKMGLTGALGKIKGFQPAVYIFTMKNRFRWTDRQETTHAGGVEVTGPTVVFKTHDASED